MNTKKPTEDLQQNDTIWLELEDFKLLCFDLARELLGQFEPIPEFVTRNPGILESCLEVPKQTYNKELLYPSLIDQAAILFYLLIKNHPFQNGNKRVALTSLLVFLALNNKWLKTSSTDLYKLAINVASSQSSKKETTLNQIKTFISDKLTETPFSV
ncbi:MAG: type II toxin-antitoxin system death-on-curing family toxin [Candidatus Daviesbacteria bacterium]|nr:type II toxin-antitoxin system death-on-curing family toxin [Candidatus Daviesbacteria bacterium]